MLGIMFRPTEDAPIESLTPHPRNYRQHPEDQLAHIRASIEEHGFYRNIVIARDGTILAGHGVVEASKQLGHESVPVIRLDIEPDDPKAMKVLTGDNSIGLLAEGHDRMLTEILKELNEDDNLLGTGFDASMLASLAMVTRPASEIASMDEAAEWVGMPEFEPSDPRPTLSISFDDEESRELFISKLGLKAKKQNGKITARWPVPEEEEPTEFIDTEDVA